MPPRVLVLGLPRTGTQSIADALAVLGYPKIYHMREVGINGHQDFWVRLIEAKAASQPLTASDFAPVLDAYDGLGDFPAAIFATELMHAYPDAHVIITNRTEDSWCASMEKNLWQSYANASDEYRQSPMQPLREGYHRLCWQDDFPSHGRDYFRAFHAAVRDLAEQQGRPVLTMELGEGWPRLCEFLGKPVPDAAWPNTDDHRHWKKPDADTGAPATS